MSWDGKCFFRLLNGLIDQRSDFRGQRTDVREQKTGPGFKGSLLRSDIIDKNVLFV